MCSKLLIFLCLLPLSAEAGNERWRGGPLSSSQFRRKELLPLVKKLKSSYHLTESVEDTAFDMLESQGTSTTASLDVAARTNLDHRGGGIKTLDASEGFPLPAVLTLFGGFLTMLSLGTVYCWGNFISYLPPHLHYFSSSQTSGAKDSLLVIPLCMLFQFVGLLGAPHLQKAVGLKQAMLFGSLMQSFGTYLASYSQNLLQFLLLYAVMFGTGIGLSYTSPLILGFKWFPARKGMVSGLVLSGFGLGGFFFNKLGSKFANPHGLNPSSEDFAQVYENFPSMLRKLAATYASMQLVSYLFFVKERKGGAVDASKTKSGGGGGGKVVTIPEALTSKEFWIVWTCITLSATAGLNTVSVYKLFGQTFPVLSNDAYLGLVGGFGAIANGVGRTAWGIGMDKVGFKRLFVFLTSLQAGIMLTMGFWCTNRVLFGLASTTLFGCLGGNFAMAPGVMAQIFGEAGPKVFGYLFSAFAVAAIGGNALNKQLQESLGYQGIFTLMAGMSLFAGALVTRL